MNIFITNTRGITYTTQPGISCKVVCIQCILLWGVLTNIRWYQNYLNPILWRIDPSLEMSKLYNIFHLFDSDSIWLSSFDPILRMISTCWLHNILRRDKLRFYINHFINSSTKWFLRTCKENIKGLVDSWNLIEWYMFNFQFSYIQSYKLKKKI